MAARQTQGLNEGRHLKLGSCPSMTMVEKPQRSLAKAISWRLSATLDTMIISFLITGRAKVAVSIGLVELLTKIFLYYLHERVWSRISFGQVRPKEDYQI